MRVERDDGQLGEGVGVHVSDAFKDSFAFFERD